MNRISIPVTAGGLVWLRLIPFNTDLAAVKFALSVVVVKERLPPADRLALGCA